MPELPDVEGHRRLAAAHVAGRTVTGVRVTDRALLEGDARVLALHVDHGVLTTAVRAGHVPSGLTWLDGQRVHQEPTCPRCGAALRRGTVASRTTVWCPREQPEAA